MSDNDKHEIHAREGGARKTSRFFFLAAQKSSEPHFGGNLILSQEPRFQKALRQKNLFLSRNSRKGSKNRRQNREQRHEETRPDSTFAAPFCLGKAPCPERLRAPKAISRQTRFDNWSFQGSDETLRKPIFLENPNSRPHYRTPAGPIIEPMNRKIWPHYRSLQHIYIYAVGREFGHHRVLIWSPKRFPLQNRAFLKGQSMEIYLA